MDCDTSDQWSGIELLRVFFLTLTFFQQNFQALIRYVIKPGMETEMKRNETAHALLVSSNYVISEILCY